MALYKFLLQFFYCTISSKLIFLMLFLIHVLLYKVIFQWVIQSSFLHLIVFLLVYSLFLNFVLIPNQIKVWDAFQTDFSLLIRKPAFCRDFFTNSNKTKSFYMNLQLLNHHQESKLFWLRLFSNVLRDIS